MVTDTEQREREVSQVAEASSRLGEIEGQVKLLVRRTEENARNAREDYRALDGKIDRTAKDLTDKIDQTAADIRADMRSDMRDMRDDMREMRAEIRRLLYWVIGIGGTMAVAVVAAIVAIIVERLLF